MTATGSVALHLRRPDGSSLDAADAARMEPGTTLVIAIDLALPAAGPAGGSPVLGTVIGWAVPQAAKHARPMLAAVVRTANTAADLPPELDDATVLPGLPARPCGRPAEAVDTDLDGVCRDCGANAEAHRTAAEIAMEASQ